GRRPGGGPHHAEHQPEGAQVVSVSDDARGQRCRHAELSPSTRPVRIFSLYWQSARSATSPTHEVAKMSSEPKLLDLAEVSRLLNKPEVTVKRYARESLLPTVKQGASL